MSIARLTESIRRAGEGIDEPRPILLAELTQDFDAPPPSTIRRIARDWTDQGAELGGHHVRTEKRDGRLYLVINPRGISFVRPKLKTSVPYFHQFGRVISY